MNSGFRPYEILLPVRFNDGAEVPDELLGETLVELRERFGAVSSETQTISGQWEHSGQVYTDDPIRLFIDVPDQPDIREFFINYKETLKNRFRQIDIWLTTYPVEVL